MLNFSHGSKNRNKSKLNIKYKNKIILEIIARLHQQQPHYAMKYEQQMKEMQALCDI